ncbi:MAG: competence protein ComF [Isosphaeraceae bacterium]|jgi:ComF family protein|nr:MAG: competence protein ComF [Isosphaeraceae bacterium]
MGVIHDAVALLDNALFPRICEICGWTSRIHGLCDSCLEAIANDPEEVCRRCGRIWPNAPAEPGLSAAIHSCPSCRGRPQSYEAAVALGPYTGSLRRLCLALKHPYQGWLAPTLMTALLERHRDWIDAWIAQSGSRRPPAVVAIPLHWTRFLVRGYNQAEALAAVLARRLGLPRLKVLRRVRATPRLAPLAASRRAVELRRAFVLRRPAHAIANRDVLLVDDVLTSGATCGAAARLLRQAGAKRVLVVVVARAEVPR